MRARDYFLQSQPLVKDCQFGVSPVNYSDSDSDTDLQIPLTKGTKDIVFVNTPVPEERIFLLKPKSAFDELPTESTDVESNNGIQRGILKDLSSSVIFV